MTDRIGAAEPAGRVSRIVLHRAKPGLVTALKAADADFAQPDFEQSVATHLRANPGLADAWASWSADQRWSPCAYIEGTEVGWFDGRRRHVQHHPDAAAATADFIHRLSAWLARGHVRSNKNLIGREGIIE